MYGWIAALAVTMGLAASTAALAAMKERDYQERLCADMRLEMALPGGGRADCVSTDFAIEVDFSEKWHQAIGQSLYYAAQTGRAPAIILVCRKAERLCLGHSLRLQATIANWALPITVFECSREAERIGRDCLVRPPGS